ncbi:MAG: hypothetical protein KDA54_04290 [Phycisphaerales bacterium]|nr:hypothetical protein [Phycisphaerales bacterium]
MLRAIALLIALGMSAHPAVVHAHPHSPLELITHEHPALGLIISIESDRIVYDVSLSNGFLNTLVPKERGFLKLRLEENTFIFEDPEQEAAERRILDEYFSQLPPLKINGVDCKPQFESFKFVRSSASANITESETLPPDARVRVVYRSSDEPRRVELVWIVFANEYSVDAFGDPIEPSLAARLDTRVRSRIITFTGDKPVIEWEAPQAQTDMRVEVASSGSNSAGRTIPIVSVIIVFAGLAGCWLAGRSKRPWRIRLIVLVIAAVTAFQVRNFGGYTLGSQPERATIEPFPKVASKVFEALLTNVYRAFDFRSESDIYDVLAQSVDGPLLDSVYKEIRAGLVSAEQGGAVAKVKSVEILESKLVDPEPKRDGAFEIKTRWRVEGMVYHWGHVHDTASIFEAIYTVAPRDGFWKIIKTDMTSASPEK